MLCLQKCEASRPSLQYYHSWAPQERMVGVVVAADRAVGGDGLRWLWK